MAKRKNSHKVTGKDVAALLSHIHSHDVKKKRHKGAIIYYEKDLLPVLEVLGLPAPIWETILSVEEYKSAKRSEEIIRIMVKDGKKPRIPPSLYAPDKFELTKPQQRKFTKWQKNLPPITGDMCSGAISFIFTPTGLGDILEVIRDDGQIIDLTEWEHFAT